MNAMISSTDIAGNIGYITHYLTLIHPSMIEDIKRIIAQLQAIVDQHDVRPTESYKEQILATPNVSRGVAITPKGIVLHHTGGNSKGSVDWVMNPTTKVSYHVIVHPNGDRAIMANDNQRTWHAGESMFAGRKDCNSFMLGIAVGGDTTKRELSFEEIDSVAQWCVAKMRRYGFGTDMIATHAQVAKPFGRRIDVDSRAKKAIIDRVNVLLNQELINPS
jgi:N-acetyl-anhydromuramyl-L-alanine amidase AmpD